MTVVGKRIRALFRSLQLTLVLSIVVPLLLFSGVAIYIGLGTVEQALNSRLQEDLELVARAVSGPVSKALAEGNELDLDESLKSIFQIGRISGASVFDAGGNRVASLGVADSDVTNSASAEKAIASGELGGAFRRVDGESVFSQFTPLLAEDGRIQGLLQVTRSRSDFHDLLASSRWWAVGIWSMLAVTIILVVVLGHYRTVGRHVNRLLEGMAELAPGQWRLDAAREGPQEIRQIQQGIRAMGERMMDAEAEIDTRVARERALAEQLEYQEKVAMIGRVAGGVAHELGAPLNVIQGRARILSRAGLAPELERHLKDIEHQVSRMTMIIQQLLDCFRHVPESRRLVDLGEILEDVLVRTRDDERCRGVDLVTREWRSAMPTRAEPLRVGLACLNVVRNACQSAAGRVELSARDAGGAWVFVVDDDGPGIPEDQRARIFEPFYSTRPAGEGTGLGLAVVNSVMKEHEGRVDVSESALGGCRVTLQFPRELPQ
ncbi:histidine kinase [Marinobacter daepoensis]|uniref:ATP-binding protein n=1 Tax=Marinobacter daepoensis TaxID=262077 RepID=UPI001C943B71|nr:ATP-binding protein [Marinobacter daepoensis]MBY6033430.1 histidine kinase [Marinobacter daepoensis]